MAIGSATAANGERIKVLQLSVQLEIPMNLEAARQLGDALLATNIKIERELPPELQ